MRWISVLLCLTGMVRGTFMNIQNSPWIPNMIKGHLSIPTNRAYDWEYFKLEGTSEEKTLSGCFSVPYAIQPRR